MWPKVNISSIAIWTSRSSRARKSRVKEEEGWSVSDSKWRAKDDGSTKADR